jgi:ubiquitin-like protein Pup
MASTEGGGQQRGSRGRDEADEAAVDAKAQGDVQERHEKLADDVDSLLDEIDGVLEENAEEFVRGYIQKGGQ